MEKSVKKKKETKIKSNSYSSIVMVVQVYAGILDECHSESNYYQEAWCARNFIDFAIKAEGYSACTSMMYINCH